MCERYVSFYEMPCLSATLNHNYNDHNYNDMTYIEITLSGRVLLSDHSNSIS